MKTSHWLLFHVFGTAFFSSLLLLAPHILADFYEMELRDNPVAMYLTRMIGWIYIGIGVMAWKMRNFGDTEAGRAFLVGLMVFDFAVSISIAHSILIGVTGSMGWLGVLFGVVLGAGCLHILGKKQLGQEN